MWELSETGRIDRLFVFRRSVEGPVVVGVLIFEGKGRVRHGRFRYAASYLGSQGRRAIDPVSLRLTPRWRDASPSEAPLAFHDSGPDGWGKGIIDRAYPDLEMGIAEYLASGGSRRTGDLSYGPTPDRPETWRPAGQPRRRFAAEDDIGMLLDAAMEADEGRATASHIARLMPSSDVGGARAKARVRHEGIDWIAKFPSRSDQFDDPRMEAVSLDVAEAAGIAVPERRLMREDGSTVLLVRRFDRDGRGGALAYLSAGTLLRQAPSVYNTNQTYLDIALVGGQIGATGTRAEMYRRYVVNALLHNTDDHLRNHAYVGDGEGWRLSPAFDVVPHFKRAAHVCAAAPRMSRERDPLGARHVHRMFGIDAATGEGIYEQARAAFSRLREFMDAREVSRADRAFVLDRLDGLDRRVGHGRGASDAGGTGVDAPPAAGPPDGFVKLVVTRREVREAIRRLRAGGHGSPAGVPPDQDAACDDGRAGPIPGALVAAVALVRFRTPPTGTNARGPWASSVGIDALEALDRGFGRGRYRSLEIEVGKLNLVAGGHEEAYAPGLLDEAFALAADRGAQASARGRAGSGPVEREAAEPGRP